MKMEILLSQESDYHGFPQVVSNGKDFTQKNSSILKLIITTCITVSSKTQL